ncbi:MAG: cell envelope integrity protein TolA [Thermodesulfovibrionales bacterium]
MKGPSLQKTAAVSAALHATIFLITLIVLRNSNRMIMPSPYVVDLVSPDRGSTGPAAEKNLSESAEQAPAVVEVPKVAEPKVVTKSPRDVKADQRRLEDSIHALDAKKKLAQLANLRKAVLSVKGSNEQSRALIKTPVKGGLRGKAGSQGGEMTYADRIKTEIHKQWSYPDSIGRNLEAIIAIRILKDGAIKIQEIEKKSGDRIFDKSVLKAIELASPVTPPPYEMEFGIRFTP